MQALLNCAARSFKKKLFSSSADELRRMSTFQIAIARDSPMILDFTKHRMLQFMPSGHDSLSLILSF